MTPATKTCIQPAGTAGGRRTRRLLYVGDLQPASTSLSRAEALEALGLPVIRFDASGVCRHRWKIMNYIGHRWYFTPKIWAKNRELVHQVRSNSPEVVWFDKPRWVFPWTFKRVRELGARLVQYNTDDLFGTEEYLWMPKLAWRHFDLVLTTNRFNVQETARWRGARSFRVGMGYDHRLYCPPKEVPPRGPDLLFIGHYELHTEAYLSAALDAGLRVEAYGGQWNRARRLELATVAPLPQSEYNAKIASAKLCLCSLSRRNRNESTGRSYEIPAIGGCMLAEDTAEHRWLFRDGEHVALFHGSDQLVARAHQLLSDEFTRKQLARSGQQRCRELQLSWQDHLRREWPICDAFFNTGKLELASADEPFWPGFRRGEAAKETERNEAWVNVGAPPRKALTPT